MYLLVMSTMPSRPVQDKPVQLDEDEAKQRYFRAAFAAHEDAEAADASTSPPIKLSKRLKPVLCNLDDMFRAIVDTIEGVELQLSRRI